MIGQDIGLPFLMPLAVGKLHEDPLAEGMHYPGDLMCAVLRVGPQFWVREETTRSEVEALAKQALTLIAPEQKTVTRALNEALSEFLSATPESNNAFNARPGKATRR
jgi:hypothetical protein